MKQTELFCRLGVLNVLEMDRMEGTIDIHAHILPGVDDGAEDWDETRWMLRCAYEHGIRAIIATPHYSPGQDVGRLRTLAWKANEEAGKISSDFHVYLGQEILYFDSMVERLKEGHALTMAGSRFVLVEFRPDQPYKKLYQAVRSLLLAGYYPIIAHVERYKALRNEKLIEELADMGCRLQMNYRSLNGSVIDRDTRWCRKQVRNDRINFLGTDAHHRDYRTPKIGKSLKWLKRHIAKQLFEKMTRGNALRILYYENQLDMPEDI